MVAQDILVVLVLVRTQVSQPKTAPENHFRGCLYFTIIRTLSVYLGSTYIRCGHTYTPSRHEIKRHTTLRQTHLILPLFFSAANDFSISGEWFFNLRRMIFQSAANDFPFCTDLFRPSPEQICNQVARQIVVCLAFFPYLCSHENENRRNDEETTPCHHLVMALHVDAGRFGLSPSPSCPRPLSGTGDGIHPSGQEYTCLYVGMYHAFPVDDTFVRLLFFP